MTNPHNKKRYGETWDSNIINEYLKELIPLKDIVVFSGGWAWHFMSPVGHIELKHAHDHKDVDIFVLPEKVPIVIATLALQGFKKVQTRFDSLKDNNDFRRYEKEMEGKKKLIIDFFVRKDLQIRIINGWQVINPEQLLTFYGNIHTSDNCFAVRAAEKLIKKNIDPVGREELIKIPQ
jgi:hypothetical protein